VRLDAVELVDGRREGALHVLLVVGGVDEDLVVLQKKRENGEREAG
jgi:hypothetical protein